MKKRVHHSPQTYIEEITGRVRLVGRGIEAPQPQGEVNRINVVEVAASENNARRNQNAGQEKQLLNPANLQNPEQNGLPAFGDPSIAEATVSGRLHSRCLASVGVYTQQHHSIGPRVQDAANKGLTEEIGYWYSNCFYR